MRPFYIWQYDNWTDFQWDDKKISKLLGEVRNLQGKVIATFSMLGMEERNNAALEAMTMDVVMSSEIEGERLRADSVRSSLARHLGLDYEGLPESDHYIEGVVEITMDAVCNCDKPVTAERLFDWHAALFPYGRSGAHKITVANWRQGDDAMLIVSGAMGKEKIHYRAPDSSKVLEEMEKFIVWLNGNNDTDSILKAAIAHLWFVAIHPFDDGNGRLTRTITDLLLARSDNTQHRYYSLSSEIRNHRKEYYDILERTSCGRPEITEWLIWFLNCTKLAMEKSLEKVNIVSQKTRFWDTHKDTPINERQRKIINMLWDDFFGKLNTSKWAKICKCSQDTALRDIHDLIDKKILKRTEEGGRSTNYVLDKSCVIKQP